MEAQDKTNEQTRRRKIERRLDSFYSSDIILPRARPSLAVQNEFYRRDRGLHATKMGLRLGDRAVDDAGKRRRGFC